MRKEEVKAVALELGADLCGIAAAKDFSGAPPGHHPQDLLPNCRAVIVLGRSFPATAMEGGSLAYTQVRDQLSETMSALAESLGWEAGDYVGGGTRDGYVFIALEYRPGVPGERFTVAPKAERP